MNRQNWVLGRVSCFVMFGVSLLACYILARIGLHQGHILSDLGQNDAGIDHILESSARATTRAILIGLLLFLFFDFRRKKKNVNNVPSSQEHSP